MKSKHGRVEYYTLAGLIASASLLELLAAVALLSYSGMLVLLEILMFISIMVFFGILNLILYSRIRNGKWPDVVSTALTLCNCESKEGNKND